MRIAALLLFVAIASGCSHTHTAVNAGAGTGTGATVTGGSVSVQGHSHSLAALVIAGMFIAATADYSQDPYPAPSFSEFADWFRGAPPPAMAADRRISERDCTKPVDETTGNLRCK